MPTRKIGFNETGVSEARYLKIKLELSEPNKDEDVWSLTATAIVSDTDNKPVADVDVQFYHNSSKVDDPVTTESDGRSTKNFPELSKGNHTFEVQIVGTDRRARQKLTLKEDKPKQPAKLAAEVVGRNGNYTLSISVMTAEGKGIKDAAVRIMDPHAEKMIENKDTDKNGSCVHDVSFTDRERIIVVVVPGTELRWQRKLLGPIPQLPQPVSTT